jgi:hypothetical protein
MNIELISKHQNKNVRVAINRLFGLRIHEFAYSYLHKED